MVDAAITYERPIAVSVVAKKGAIVRAGRDKATSWVMKLLPGMEALAVGEALEPVEGVVRVRLAEPCAGWATLKMFKPYRADAAWGSAGLAAPPAARERPCGATTPASPSSRRRTRPSSGAASSAPARPRSRPARAASVPRPASTAAGASIGASAGALFWKRRLGLMKCKK